MTDRPIIFSGPMVRALMDGRKTMTRRVLKPQPDPSLPIGGSDFVVMGQGDPGSWCWLNGFDGSIVSRFNAPYAPGNRLYVREAHALVGTVDPGWLLYRCDGYESECIRNGFTRPFPPESAVRWRPSIHMPRWASRLTLTVTDVRVQRLVDLSEEDAMAEGVEADPETGAYWGAEGAGVGGATRLYTSARLAFADLWNSIHGPDAWDANPWVAAISFDVKRGNIDEVKA